MRVWILAMLVASMPLFAEDEKPWAPNAPLPKTLTHDWLRMKNGEWLKGELLNIRVKEVLFESDEFDEQTLELDDVAEIHTAKMVVISDNNLNTYTGYISLIDDKLIFRNTDKIMPRSEMLSIARNRSDFLSLWKGGITLGSTFRRGNTNSNDIQALANLTYRSIWQRFELGYIGNLSEKEGEQTASNNRANAKWDRFINRRLYVTPLSYEYYNDYFQNIAHRHTPSAGMGYSLLDYNACEWNLTAGLGYQLTEYVSTTTGQDDHEEAFVGLLGTTIENKITKHIDFDVEYKLQASLNKDNNLYHHTSAILSVELTGNLDLDVTFTWDRNSKPKSAADGKIPKKDDYRLSVGLGFDL